MKQSQAGRHVGDLGSGFCSFLNLPTEALHPQLKRRMAACSAVQPEEGRLITAQTDPAGRTARSTTPLP